MTTISRVRYILAGVVLLGLGSLGTAKAGPAVYRDLTAPTPTDFPVPTLKLTPVLTLPTAAPTDTPEPTPGPDYNGKESWDGQHWVIRATTKVEDFLPPDARWTGAAFSGSALLMGAGGSSVQQSFGGDALDKTPWTWKVRGCMVSVSVQKTSDSPGKLLRLQLIGGGQVYGDAETTEAYGVVSLSAHSPGCY